MNKFEIKALRKRVGLSQEKFGKLFGVSLATVHNWELGHPISRTNQALLADFATRSSMGTGITYHADNIVSGNGNTLLARHASMSLDSMIDKGDKQSTNEDKVSALRKHIELLMKQNELLTRNMECLARQLEMMTK